MFSTDVAARGLDFPNIDWVVQFDAPEDPAAYIHRVGRAGRFRSKGNALTFVLPSEEAAFLDMMAEARIPVKRIAVNGVGDAARDAGGGEGRGAERAGGGSLPLVRAERGAGGEQEDVRRGEAAAGELRGEFGAGRGAEGESEAGGGGEGD